VREFQEIVVEHTGKPFPQDPTDQLWGAVAAVFRSWDNVRARRYRKIHEIPESWGTAVNVQAMVFGNMGESSATGVAFTTFAAAAIALAASSTATAPATAVAPLTATPLLPVAILAAGLDHRSGHRGRDRLGSGHQRP